MNPPRLTASNRAQIALVVLIWASNFIVVKWGLGRVAPLALCTLRFAFSFFPICLFVRPPRGRWGLLLLFGAITGLGQFGLLFVAMRDQISPAIAAVVVQTQAFFNVALAAVLLRERVTAMQVAGCLLAAAGLAVIGLAAGAPATALGLVLTLLSGLSWASCNVLLRHSRYDGDMLGLMVWMSPFAMVPLAFLSILTEGAGALIAPFARLDGGAAAVVAWQAYANTIVGYAIWNRLIRSHGLARIAPLTLLVPVVAMGMAVGILGERLEVSEVVAATLIIAGVVLPQLGARATAARERAARD